MSISKWQVHSSSNFALLVIAMTYRTPLLNFKLIQFLLWTKGSHQSLNFVTQVLRWKFAKFLIFFKTQVSFSSNFATIFHVMKDNSSVLFCLTIIYFGHKESIKQFFRLLSAQVKICQIPHVNFRTPFLYHSSLLLRHITPLQILSSYIFYFEPKDPTKVPNLTFLSALLKVCQISRVIFQTTSQYIFSSNFASFQCHER